jgi:hypothetical protein
MRNPHLERATKLCVEMVKELDALDLHPLMKSIDKWKRAAFDVEIWNSAHSFDEEPDDKIRDEPEYEPKDE